MIALAQQRGKLARICLILLGIIFLSILTFGFGISFIRAQSNDNWSEPLNLSQLFINTIIFAPTKSIQYIF